MSVSVDTKELKQLVERLEKVDIDLLMKNCGDRLMSELLRKVTKATPVGKKPVFKNIENKKSRTKARKLWKSYQGGTLRRGWTAPGNNTFRQKTGNTYKIGTTNNVHYAHYVEHGHRQRPGRYVPHIGKRLVRSAVRGRQMVGKSEEKINGAKDSYILSEVEKAIAEAFK